jgi:hypothetical protein
MVAQSPTTGSAREIAPMKRSYVAPELVTWGSLREITKHVGAAGKADGGKTKK